MNKKQFAFTFRKFHKWIALIVGVQALIWCLSGLYMTSIHIDIIRGEHLVKNLDSSQSKLNFNPQLEITNTELPVDFVSLSLVNDKSVLKLNSKVALEPLDASTGKVYIPISQKEVEAIALAIYDGDANVLAVKLLSEYPAEIGGRKKPVWQVTYDDWLNSTLYFDSENAKLIRARSDLWRWFDFLWMLHIMDYETREDINNNLLRIAASLGLVFALFGFGLLFYSFGHRKEKQSSSVGILKKVHRWLALLIGIQLIIWMVTGLLFSLLDHGKVSGNQLLNPSPVRTLNFEPSQLAEILSTYPEVKSIEATHFLDNRYYQLESSKGVFLVNANDLLKVEINKTLAKEIAESRFKEDARLVNVERLDEKTIETRKFPHPLWKVDFDDEENSSVYVHADSGRVVGVKTDTWRLFDFLWMLHIMDYGERDDFNHALIIFAAVVSSFIALSGFIMLFSAFSLKDLNLRNRFVSKTVEFRFKNGRTVVREVFGLTRLVDLLRKNKLVSRTDCGGGGSCGLCRVKLSSEYPVSDADRRLLSSEELNRGYRLSCQVQIVDGLSVNLANKYSEKLN